MKAFNRLAEIAGEHLHKGSRIYVEGRKRTESWDDKQTGAKHYRDLVYVDRIEFLDSRGSGNGHAEPAEQRRRRDNMTDQETAVLTQDFESCVHFFLQPHRWDNVLHGLFATGTCLQTKDAAFVLQNRWRAVKFERIRADGGNSYL